MRTKFLTIEQVAKILGLNYKTVFRYIHNKQIKATKIGRWRIEEKDLKKFVKQSSNFNM